ncbi:MAG: hypothetical protein GQE15_13055 [Archangiaceae bacterium]|nr:hypothetical protein [Archangiaceae bacterium]
MRLCLVSLVCVLTLACGPAASSPPAPETPKTTSYLRDVQPLVERSCRSCHTAGGVAPLVLDTPEQVAALGPTLWSAIASNRMPPFFAAPSCNSYVDDPRLTDAEKTLFKTWVDEGSPMGDPAEARHAPTPQLPVVRHDIELSIGARFDVRKMNDTDNYQCFVLNPANTADVMVKGYEVIPGNLAVVHHVLAYVVTPDQVSQLEALDAQDPKPGYACQTGGVGITGAVRNQIAGWVPGQYPSRMPADTALVLPAGSRLVMQLHYNLNALADPAVSPFDETKLALETVPMNTLRKGQILPMLKPNLAIAAGDTNSVQVTEVPVPASFRNATIFRAMGHAHQLATQVKLEVVKADGSTTCVLDNPRWDFNWQRDYTLKTPVTLVQGDKLRITCVYDNGQANQPFIAGVQQTPRAVAWGESSFDEMCMTYLTFAQ